MVLEKQALVIPQRSSKHTPFYCIAPYAVGDKQKRTRMLLFRV